MQYSPNKWQVKIKRNKDYMYITQHSFSTESSAQLLTEIHELKKKDTSFNIVIKASHWGVN